MGLRDGVELGGVVAVVEVPVPTALLCPATRAALQAQPTVVRTRCVTCRTLPWKVILITTLVKGIQCSGNWAGTSFAAPRWAGFMAVVNQQAVEAGTAPTGGIGFSLFVDFVVGVDDLQHGDDVGNLR